MDNNEKMSNREGLEELRRRMAAREAAAREGGGSDNRQQVSIRRPVRRTAASPVFKTWKLVSEILSIILCLLVMFQSCAAGILNSVTSNGQSSGSAGVVVAIMLLAGGIVSIATRNSRGTGGDTALLVLFGIGTVAGYLLAGSFRDLLVWATWCLVNAALAVVSIARKKGAKHAVKTTGKIIAIALVGVIVILMLGWMWIGSLMKKTTGPDRPAVTSSQSEGNGRADISYEVYMVTELFDLLHENAMNAEQTFNGKYVELYGVVCNIDSDGRYISIDAGKMFSLDRVQCFIKDKAVRDSVSQLSTDDMVGVRGKITSVGELLGYSLDMDDIVVVPPEIISDVMGSSQTKEQLSTGIGEPATLDGIQATMLDVYESQGEGSIKPDEGKIFIVCEFEVENGSNDDLHISGLTSYDAYVDDYDVDIEWIAPGDIETLGGTIAPGKKTHGAIVCQADPDWSTVEIHLKPNMFGDGSMVFVASK